MWRLPGRPLPAFRPGHCDGQQALPGRVVVILPGLATFVIWWEVVPNHRTLRRQGLLVAAAVALVTAAAEGASMYVAVPYSYDGWLTRITVSFTGIRGRPVRAHYTDYCRAGRKQEGQTIQIVCDPEMPTSLSPVGRCSRPEDPAPLRRS